MLYASDVRSSCRIVPGLNKEQLNLCYRANDVTRAAFDGLDMAMRECQSQVQYLPICNRHSAAAQYISFVLVSVASLELFITEYKKTKPAYIESIEKR